MHQPALCPSNPWPQAPWPNQGHMISKATSAQNPHQCYDATHTSLLRDCHMPSHQKQVETQPPKRKFKAPGNPEPSGYQRCPKQKAGSRGHKLRIQQLRKHRKPQGTTAGTAPWVGVGRMRKEQTVYKPPLPGESGLSAITPCQRGSFWFQEH